MIRSINELYDLCGYGQWAVWYVFSKNFFQTKTVFLSHNFCTQQQVNIELWMSCWKKTPMWSALTLKIIFCFIMQFTWVCAMCNVQWSIKICITTKISFQQPKLCDFWLQIKQKLLRNWLNMEPMWIYRKMEKHPYIYRLNMVQSYILYWEHRISLIQNIYCISIWLENFRN